jgi:hypothetical protein
MFFRRPSSFTMELPFHCYPLDGQFVCLDTDGNKVFVTDDIGRQFWRLLCSGSETDNDLATLAFGFGVPEKLVKADYLKFSEQIATLPEVMSQAMADYCADSGGTVSRALKSKSNIDVYLPGIRIRVYSESALVLQQLEQWFLLRKPVGILESELLIFSLAVFYENNRYLIVPSTPFDLAAGKVPTEQILDRSDTELGASLLCLQQINLLALHSRPWSFLIHAGCVAFGDESFIFPAVGGSGKSTLTSYLIHNGFKLLADDTVALNDSGEYLTPVCIPICLKEGSWSVVEQMSPALATQVFAGVPPSRVKYLPPQGSQIQHVPVACRNIISPRYDPDIKCASLTPAGRPGMLRKLLEGGSSTEQPVKPSNLEALVKFVDASCCYELTFSKLEEVIPLLMDLAGQPA